MRARTSCIVCATITLLIAANPIAAEGHVPHTVEPGESLWSIALEAGLRVDELAAANGLSPDAALVAGDTVLIPSASVPGPPASPIGDSVASGSGECVWHCDSAVHPHPTDETVSPGQVGSIGAAYGMSPSLVESLAWNESAFSNAAVSSAGARGVMQIIPETWNFIDEQLADQPLDPVSATDNVEAGVTYLHYLYHLKSGDGQATVASYFQGPNREGLLPETQAYLRQIREDAAKFAGAG
jgi:LysM repeat protein